MAISRKGLTHVTVPYLLGEVDLTRVFFDPAMVLGALVDFVCSKAQCTRVEPCKRHKSERQETTTVNMSF
jgi:hypothetical protein